MTIKYVPDGEGADCPPDPQTFSFEPSDEALFIIGCSCGWTFMGDVRDAHAALRDHDHEAPTLSHPEGDA